MVTGKGDLPYVRVYRDTLPVLYSLRELARWPFYPLYRRSEIFSGAEGD